MLGRSQTTRAVAAAAVAMLTACLLRSASAAPAGSIGAITPARVADDQRVEISLRTSSPFPQDGRLTRVELEHVTYGTRIAGEVAVCGARVEPGATASPGTRPSVDPSASPVVTEGTPRVDPNASPVRPGEPPGVERTADPTADVRNCGATTEVVAQLSLAPAISTGAARSGVPPGLYNAYVYLAGTPRTSGDTCSACFTVLRGGGVFLFSVTPGEIAAGTSGALVVHGHNLSTDAIVDALFPGTNTVDRAVWLPARGDASHDPWARPSSLNRSYVVRGDAAPGKRDIRVRVPYGGSARLADALTIGPRPGP